MLAREAGGSMRDAERMLETAIASLDGKVTETEVASILGVASRTRVFGIVEALLAKDAAGALGTVRELHRSGANLESLGRDILELLRNLAVAKLPDASGPQGPLADLPDQEATELKRLAATVSTRDLMRLFRLMADAQEQLIRSPYPDLLLEMAVIRMAALAPVIDADELLRAIGASGTGGSTKGAGGGGNAPDSASGAGGTAPVRGTVKAAPKLSAFADPAPTPVPDSVFTPAPLSAPVESVLAPAPARRIKVDGEVKAEAPIRPILQPQTVQSAGLSTSAPAPGTTAAAVAPAAARASIGLPDLRDFIRSRRAALFGFMEQGAALALNGDVLTIIPRNDIYVRYLSDNRSVIAELASELYGRRIRAEMASLGAPIPPSGNAASGPPSSDAQPTPPQDTAPATASSSPPSAAAFGDESPIGAAASDVVGAAASDGKNSQNPGITTNGSTAVQGRSAGQVDAASANSNENGSTSPTSGDAPDASTPAPSGNGTATEILQNKLKQSVYGDPVVRRIFDEFQARLVEVRAQPAVGNDLAPRKP